MDPLKYSEMLDELHQEATREMEDNGHDYKRALEYAVETLVNSFKEEIEEAGNVLLAINERK